MIGAMEPELGDVRIAIEPAPAPADVQRIVQGLVEHALEAGIEPRRYTRLVLFARDADGQIVGGLTGAMVWGWLEVGELWVAEPWRGRGIGRRLLAAAEVEARRNGCRHARLDTFDFQARGFYERLGYATHAELADFPHGHVRYLMRKPLPADAAQGSLSAADLARLETAGVYDAGAADAEAQRSVLQLMTAGGITTDEIVTAHRLGDLVLRGFERLIRPGTRHSEDEAAAAVGMPVAEVRRIWRAWGFPDPGAGERCWTDRDIGTLRLLTAMVGIVGEELTMHSARAMGTAMSRIAEAEIALMRSQVEAPMTRDRVATASILARYRLIVEQLLPASASGMDALHRAYLVHLGQRYREWARSPSEHNVVDLVVGFADLTGSTALVQQLDLAALDRALVGFEERTSDLIAAAGASVVKRLGDGVMFVATEAETACRLALDLVAAFAPPAAGPPVRVGLAAGSVAALRGDFFGPAVHLAARIVGVTPPGTAVASQDVCQRAPTIAARSLGTVALAGFDEPVLLMQLER